MVSADEGSRHACRAQVVALTFGWGSGIEFAANQTADVFGTIRLLAGGPQFVDVPVEGFRELSFDLYADRWTMTFCHTIEYY